MGQDTNIEDRATYLLQVPGILLFALAFIMESAAIAESHRVRLGFSKLETKSSNSLHEHDVGFSELSGITKDYIRTFSTRVERNSRIGTADMTERTRAVDGCSVKEFRLDPTQNSLGIGWRRELYIHVECAPSGPKMIKVHFEDLQSFSKDDFKGGLWGPGFWMFLIGLLLQVSGLPRPKRFLIHLLRRGNGSTA